MPDLATDPHICKVSSWELFTKEEGIKLAKVVLDEAKVAHNRVTFEVSSIGKEIAIMFGRWDRDAGMLVKQTLEGQRINDKPCISGSVCDAFVNRDKSKSDVRLEIACKKVKIILSEHYKVFFEWRRKEAQVTSGWKAVANIRYVKFDATAILDATTVPDLFEVFLILIKAEGEQEANTYNFKAP